MGLIKEALKLTNDPTHDRGARSLVWGIIELLGKGALGLKIDDLEKKDKQTMELALLVTLEDDLMDLRAGSKATRADLQKVRQEIHTQYSVIAKLLKAQEEDRETGKTIIKDLVGDLQRLTKEVEEKAKKKALELQRELNVIKGSLGDIKAHWEELLLHMRRGGSSPTPFPTPTSPTPTQSKPPPPPPPPQPRPRPTRKPGACFNCYKEGHWAYECLRPKRY